MTLRVLFHVNHLWGVGHFTRTAALANAVVAAGGSATILSGNTPVPGRLDPAVSLVTLPAIRAEDTSYARLVTAGGGPVTEDIWSRRAAILAETLSRSAPNVLVTETFPFGRRKLAREILPLIEAAHAAGAKIVASVRDLPTPPADEKRLAECADRLARHYDAVLIHGDPAITPLNEIWPGEIPVPARLTGYVVAAVTPAPHPARRGVIVSAGGGGDAAPLLTAAVTARHTGILADEPWIFITGQHAPEGLIQTLRAAAARTPGLEIRRNSPDFPTLIASARLSISRGGYNTVAESLATGTPTLLTPFAPDGEPEQRLRAERFAALGLVTHLPEDQLARLPQAITAALAAPPPEPGLLLTGGAAASAAALAEIAAGS